MRFRRFKEKHDTSLLNSASSLTAAKNGEGDDGDSEVPAKKTSPKKKPTPKKRKIDEVAVKDEPEDDEDLVRISTARHPPSPLLTLDRSKA